MSQKFETWMTPRMVKESATRLSGKREFGFCPSCGAVIMADNKGQMDKRYETVNGVGQCPNPICRAIIKETKLHEQGEY
jgi:ribosomal protein S27AE